MNRIIDWWHRRFGTTMPRHVRVLEVFLTDPERWWFGYDLIQDTQLSSGKLYPTLARLERDAWITGAFEDIKENEEGRPARRGYRLTEAGRVHARALVAKWKGGSDCLQHLVPELHGFGVSTLYMEARTRDLDQRDIRSVINARRALPRGSTFDIEHVRGVDDPLLWVADVLAGAVRAGRHGEASYRAILADRIYDIDVDTRC